MLCWLVRALARQETKNLLTKEEVRHAIYLELL